MMELNKEFYSTGEVAKFFGVTTETVANWIKQGKIKAILLPSGRRRIHRSEILKLLKGENND